MFRKLLNRLFGYRWSLYFKGENNLVYYVMHSNSAIGLLKMVEDFYIARGNPREPWKVYLNFNKTNSHVLLDKQYFSSDSEVSEITDKLLGMISKLDPNFLEYTGTSPAPIFKDLVSGKYLPLWADLDTAKAIEARLAGNQRPNASDTISNLWGRR